MKTSPKPCLVILASQRLFDSFFTKAHQEQLAARYQWILLPSRHLNKPLRQALSRAEAVITTWDSPRLEEDVTDWATRLRIISHCGGEVKGRFASVLFDRVVITNAPGPMARPVAELAVTFLLYFARNIDFYRKVLQSRSNSVYLKLHLEGSGNETLLGRTVSMIGYGRIGHGVAELLRPFGTRLVVYDPYVKAPTDSQLVRFAPLRDVLKASDLLLLTAALTEKTRGLLNQERLAALPDGTTIINVARGGLIDLEALTREVVSGRLRCALDVTDPLEPLPSGHPLRNAAGAVVTPHVGAASVSVRHEMTSVVLSDLAKFFRGEPVANRVTRSMLTRMT